MSHKTTKIAVDMPDNVVISSKFALGVRRFIVGLGKKVLIANILGELNGEKIDIFVWKSNPIDLIAEALTPARVVSVMPDEKEKRALVIANDDQFSLAIGRNGQNAKLAAFATGWKIDIKTKSEIENRIVE